MLPEILALVVREAFSTDAARGTVAGGAMMLSMRYGIARGIYANEAGYGTAAVAYGTAQSDRPVQQGLNAVMEVFIVSFVTSTISALTILVSGAWKSGLPGRGGRGRGLRQRHSRRGRRRGGVLHFLFGYTTLIGWAYYGEQFLEYLTGRKVTTAYRWIYCLLIPFGAMAHVDVVWAWGDLMNALQIFPNVIGLIGLSGCRRERSRADDATRHLTSPHAATPCVSGLDSLALSPLDRSSRTLLASLHVNRPSLPVVSGDKDRALEAALMQLVPRGAGRTCRGQRAAAARQRHRRAGRARHRGAPAARGGRPVRRLARRGASRRS